MAVTPTELERVTPEIRQVKESINEVSSENRSRFVYFSCSRGAWERDAQLYALQCGYSTPIDFVHSHFFLALLLTVLVGAQ